MYLNLLEIKLCTNASILIQSIQPLDRLLALATFVLAFPQRKSCELSTKETFNSNPSGWDSSIYLRLCGQRHKYNLHCSTEAILVKKMQSVAFLCSLRYV